MRIGSTISRRVGVIAVTTTLLGAAPAAGATNAPEPPTPPARAWLLIDARDEARLAASDEDARASIASTTKLMTAYLTLRDLPPGKVVTAPPYDALPAESLLGLTAGEQISVRDLLYGLLLPSGNDAAVALAVADAGSVPAFVEKMNRAGRRLGLRGTSYSNPIGLDAPDNYSTARDLAELTLRLRRDPQFRRIVDTPEKTLTGGDREHHVVNRNLLVDDVPWVNGVKTGHTIDAGYVLVASGTRKGVTLVSVVLGAPSEPARDEGALALLDYGFKLYHRHTPVKKRERMAAPALRFRDERLPLVAARALGATVRDDQTLRARVMAPAEVDGPIRRGERVGRASLVLDGKEVARTPLVAAHAVPAATIADRVDSFVPGPRFIAWLGVFAIAALLVLAVVRVLGHRSSDSE